MNLWDDPPETTRREFKHGPWAGMPPRHEWNSSPNHQHDKTCIECGYRWGSVDLTYRSHPNNPSDEHAICWNCWMIDNNPEEVGKFWDRINGVPAKADPPPRFDHV